jgi:hypothetical protein
MALPLCAPEFDAAVKNWKNWKNWMDDEYTPPANQLTNLPTTKRRVLAFGWVTGSTCRKSIKFLSFPLCVLLLPGPLHTLMVMIDTDRQALHDLN